MEGYTTRAVERVRAHTFEIQSLVPVTSFFFSLSLSVCPPLLAKKIDRRVIPIPRINFFIRPHSSHHFTTFGSNLIPIFSPFPETSISLRSVKHARDQSSLLKERYPTFFNVIKINSTPRITGRRVVMTPRTNTANSLIYQTGRISHVLALLTDRPAYRSTDRASRITQSTIRCEIFGIFTRNFPKIRNSFAGMDGEGEWWYFKVNFCAWKKSSRRD